MTSSTAERNSKYIVIGSSLVQFCISLFCCADPFPSHSPFVWCSKSNITTLLWRISLTVYNKTLTCKFILNLLLIKESQGLTHPQQSLYWAGGLSETAAPILQSAKEEKALQRLVLNADAWQCLSLQYPGPGDSQECMALPSSKPLTRTLPSLQHFLPLYNCKIVVPSS